MSDVEAAPQGQAAPESAPAQGQAKPFFSYKHHDGKEDVYQSAEELQKAYRDSYMRHSDYTRKTQEIAEQRKKFEQQQKELQEAMKRVQDKDSQFAKFDKLVRERPDLFNQLKQAATRPPDASVAFDRAQSLIDERTSELRKELDEFKKWRHEQEVERQKASVYEELKGEYPDFDRDSVEEMIKDLSGGDWKKLLSTLYFAQKGRSGPQLAERAKMADEVKAQAKVPPPGKPKAPSGKNFKSLADVTNDLVARVS